MSDSISPSPRRKKQQDDLDERQTPNKRVPAWKLREQMKSQQPPSTQSSVSRGPISGGPLSKAYRKPLGAMDPSLPPAFRAAFKSQRKKEVDDFMSLDSVHTSTSQNSTSKKTLLTSGMTATPTSNDSDNSSLDDSESTFDGHDSFASLGEDSDDDEAYREGRNQIAKQTVECSRPTASRGLKSNDLRFRKGGVHGTPLNFIPE